MSTGNGARQLLPGAGRLGTRPSSALLLNVQEQKSLGRSRWGTCPRCAGLDAANTPREARCWQRVPAVATTSEPVEEDTGLEPPTGKKEANVAKCEQGVKLGDGFLQFSCESELTLQDKGLRKEAALYAVTWNRLPALSSAGVYRPACAHLLSKTHCPIGGGRCQAHGMRVQTKYLSECVPFF